MLTTIKKYTRLILINLSVLLLFLLTGEVLVRLFVNGINLADTSSDIFQENRFYDTTGFLPNITGSSFGKRIMTDKEGFVQLKCTNYPEGKKSILFLGDSVTQGVGVERDSSFVGKLSCYYQDSVNIINSAIIGYNFYDYENILKFLLIENKLNVSHIVINYCLNDIYDRDTKSPSVKTKNFLGKFLAYLKSNSYFYIWLKATFTDRSKAYFLHDFELHNDIAKLNNVKGIVEDITQFCAQKNIRLEVLLYPYEYQLRMNTSDLFLPQDKIENIFKKQGVKIFQPHHFLKKYIRNTKDLYLFGDGLHFSTQGHDLIFDFFVKEKILE